ncbi:Peptidyl-tRNA hydrolase [Dissostichus eleginoides]|uniref:Peptidyl-tRNA hydrolase n=1 Tax=Dissostichus eleginoides TaxID=100907 RepID=A0AAD9CCC3_DISEL|nr:Peptidyl-tRNA hydrolase [Dissostichus eleginoides]
MKSVTTPDGDQIRLLPDFTQAVSKQRAAFTEYLHLKLEQLKHTTRGSIAKYYKVWQPFLSYFENEFSNIKIT